MDAITLEKVFGSDGAQFINLTRTLVEAIERQPPTYTYMAPDEFNSLIEMDWKAGTKIYWEELLGRAHLAAVASIIRAYRWSCGMAVCYSSDLFLPFCASFRALIESAADGYDALSNVASTLADYRGIVNQSLQGKAEQPVLAVELEDQLIHFSHARKLSKVDASPVSHKAKQTADYVRSLEKADLPRLYECYSDLCQYTHPAAQSVLQFLVPLSPETFLLASGQDRVRIEAFSKEYNSLLVPLLMVAFNPGALLLKVLLYFDAPQFHSQGINLLDLRGISGWVKYAKKMGVEP